MNNETTLSAQQSVEVIEKMIRENNKRLERDSAIPFLIWGYSTVLVSLAVFFLLPILGTRAHFIWIGIPFIGLICGFITNRKQSGAASSERGFHLIGKFMSVLWTVLGINCFFCSFIGSSIVLTLVLVIIGSGAVITAFTLGFNSLKLPSIIGVLVGYMLAVVDLGNYEILIFAAAFVIMMIIPGHYLHSQYKNR